MSFSLPRLFFVDNSASSGGTGDVIRSREKTASIKTQVVVIDKGGTGTEDLTPLEGTDITSPTAMPAGGVGVRGWLSAIWTKLNGSLAVTGTFFQATQPVSNAGTFAVQAAAILAAETTKIIGTVNLSAAQTLAVVTTVGAVTAITNALPTGANTIGAVTNVNLDVALSTRLKPADTLAAVTILGSITNALPAGTNALGNINELRAATLAVTVTAATGVAATLTLPAVAAQFHYITSIDIYIYATAARTGSATPVVVTTTNLPGSPAFTFETAQAIGTNTPIQGYNLTTPLKSSVVNTATTIVAPIATTGIWRITVTYFTGA